MLRALQDMGDPHGQRPLLEEPLQRIPRRPRGDAEAAPDQGAQALGILLRHVQREFLEAQVLPHGRVQDRAKIVPAEGLGEPLDQAVERQDLAALDLDVLAPVLGGRDQLLQCGPSPEGAPPPRPGNARAPKRRAGRRGWSTGTPGRPKVRRPARSPRVRKGSCDPSR